MTARTDYFFGETVTAMNLSKYLIIFMSERCDDTRVHHLISFR